jgi:hypothetical protein
MAACNGSIPIIVETPEIVIAKPCLALYDCPNFMQRWIGPPHPYNANNKSVRNRGLIAMPPKNNL